MILQYMTATFLHDGSGGWCTPDGRNLVDVIAFVEQRRGGWKLLPLGDVRVRNGAKRTGLLLTASVPHEEGEINGQEEEQKKDGTAS